MHRVASSFASIIDSTVEVVPNSFAQQSDLARFRGVLFVFDSCDFVDRRRFPRTGAIHEVTRKNTKLIKRALSQVVIRHYLF